jgi:hypothetical protein
MQVVLVSCQTGKSLEKDIPPLDRYGMADGRDYEVRTGQSQFLTHAIAGCRAESLNINGAGYDERFASRTTLTGKLTADGIGQRKDPVTAPG